LIGAERIVRYSSRSNLLDRLAVPTIRNGLTGPFRGFPGAQLHSLGETKRHALGADTDRLTRERNGSHPEGAERNAATGGRLRDDGGEKFVIGRVKAQFMRAI